MSIAWSHTRKRVLARDGWQCRYCDQPGETVDHVLPRSRGGGDTMDNLVCACRKCNARAADKAFLTIEEKRAWIRLVRGLDRG